MTKKELKAEVRRIEAENTTLRNAQKACEDCMTPTYAALRTRIEELEEDSARYRFLRFNPPVELAVYVEKKTHEGTRLVYHDGAELDNAIDAARNQQEKQT